MKSRISMVIAAVALAVGSSSAQETSIPLNQWDLVGKGFASPVEDATLLSEYPGSAGVMLVHPEVFSSNMSLTFDVMPLNPESVLVALISASSGGKQLRFPDNYDGSISYLLGEVDGYFFAFHNAAHNRTPFVRRHPVEKGASKDLAVAKESVMTRQWHHVTIDSNENGHLRMDIDGENILSALSPNPLSGGKIILRIRGTETHTASALFRNIELTPSADLN